MTDEGREGSDFRYPDTGLLSGAVQGGERPQINPAF